MNTIPPLFDPETGSLNISWAFMLVGFMLGTMVGGEMMKALNGNGKGRG